MTRRPIRISSVVLLALLIFCWQSAAQNPGGSQPPGTTPGSGPYQAVMEMDPGLPDHTIYRPENLSALNGATLPIVVWGNGACVMSFGHMPGAAQGTIAPEGGCPGNFFTSRKWTFEHSDLIIRDHKGEALADLSFAGGRFEGHQTAGGAISLSR